MASPIIVERGVYHSNADTTLVRDVSEDMLLLEPDQSPLLVLTNKNNRKDPSDTPKFQWFEKTEVAIWDTVGTVGATASTTETTMYVTDYTLYAVGDVLLFPQAATVATGEELALISAVATTGIITVSRGYAGSTVQAVASGQSVRILCSALTEGGAVTAVRSQAPVAKTSYCQIFRTPVDVSRTMQATKAYASPEGKRIEGQVEALRRHKQEIESAGLWSKGTESLAAGGSSWATLGVKPTIATNITNGATTFTITKFNDFCETAFRYGATEKLLMAAPKIISAMNYFSQNKLLTSNGDKTFGVAIQRVLGNGFGEFLLANNFRMGDAPSSTNGFTDEAYSIDLPNVRYRYLNGNGNSQDTKLFSDVKKDGYARNIDEYYSQVGWEVRHELKHARIHNVTSYS